MMHILNEGLSALETAQTYVEQQSEASVMDVLMFRQADNNDIFFLNIVCTFTVNV